jgi:hypothetical protein
VTPLIRYRDGYRFQLATPYSLATSITEACAGNAFVSLAADGLLSISAGYAWDGASGPVRQTPNIIRGSLVHDALYQLMRECGLSSRWRSAADDLLRDLCIADGMPRWHADLVHAAVSHFGAQYADPRSIRPVLVAPVAVAYPSVAEMEPS